MTPGAFAGRMHSGVSMAGSHELAMSPLLKDTTNYSPITAPQIPAYALAQKAFMQVWGSASKFPAGTEFATPEAVDYDCTTSGASDQETQDLGGGADIHFSPPTPDWFHPPRVHQSKQAAAAAAAPAAEGGTSAWGYPCRDHAKKQVAPAAFGRAWVSPRADDGVARSRHSAGSFAADTDGAMHKVPSTTGGVGVDQVPLPPPACRAPPGLAQVLPPAPVGGAPQGLPAAAGPTTLILRSIPARCTIEEVLQLIHDSGFQGSFEFLYVPIKPGTRMNKGYGFVAFADFDGAMRFFRAMDGKSFGSRTSTKEISVDLAKAHISLAQMPTTVAKTSRWGPVLAMQ